MSARSVGFALAPRLVALLFLATCAHAAPPSIRYSWDECDPLVLDREFAGPAHYSQTLSVVGLTRPLTSFQVNVVIGLGQPSAWQFYASGCQGAGRLTATATAAGCDPVSDLTLSVSMLPGLTDFRLHLMVNGTAPASAAPDPTARYLLARLDFDHTYTTTGSIAPPGQCGNGDWLQCFGVEYVALNGAAEPGVDYVLENSTLTWNEPSSPGQCPFPVRMRSSTWGRLKALYR